MFTQQLLRGVGVECGVWVTRGRVADPLGTSIIKIPGRARAQVYHSESFPLNPPVARGREAVCLETINF